MDSQTIRELRHARNNIPPGLRELAQALGGEIVGGQVLCPGPGHSARDRSLAVRPSAQSPFGFIAHSHAGDPWRGCRDYVLENSAGRHVTPPMHEGAPNNLRTATSNAKIMSASSMRKPPGCGRAADRSPERLPSSICAERAGIPGQYREHWHSFRQPSPSTSRR